MLQDLNIDFDMMDANENYFFSTIHFNSLEMISAGSWADVNAQMNNRLLVIPPGKPTSLFF